MHQFSIITPTYNRANYLPAIFECLKEQGKIDLEWIIIDDGSNDNTKDIVYQFNGPFCIKYHYQENSGKPKASNKGVEFANSHISLIHDDDDTLLPNLLPQVWNYYDSSTETFHDGCACLSGLCIYDNGEIIGDKFPFDYHISDSIEYRYNKKIRGDKCDFYLTSVLKEYPFPIINNEKFIGESIVWNRIALKHKTIYINTIFQRKVFLKGGLSDQPIWRNNPQGSELLFNEATNPRFSLIIRLKHYAKYIQFAKYNKKSISQIYSSSISKNIFFLGLFFYFLLLIWSFFKINLLIRKMFRNKKNYWKKIE